MKKYFKYLFVIILLFFISINNVSAKEEIKLYLFHGDGCPHCKEEGEYLEKLERKYKNLKIIKYEVWKHDDNAFLMKRVGQKFDINVNSVPLTIISSTPITGFSEATKKKIERTINFYQDNPKYNKDYIKEIKNGTYSGETIEDEFKTEDQKSDDSTIINIPIIGNVNMKNVSIPTASIVIGLVDGFNPCAMWVLLFLISMLLGHKDRKRMLILGIIFLTTSALVYMGIMLSWFNIVINVMASVVFRNIIAVVALIGAFVNLFSYFRSKDSGCQVVDDKKRKRVIEKIKKFTKEKSLFLAILGVISLAVSVNVIELACSAGLPLVFTQILALNHVSGIQSFFYTLLYILFFLIDDILIFVIAMKTAKINAISTKYTKYSHLVGGIIMLIIGILLILKPEWLMFNF